MLDTPIKPADKVDGYKYGLDLAEHMAEHIYMFTSEKIYVRFRANSYIINDVIDYFGTDIDIFDVTENDFMVRVHISEEDMFKWAVQYAGHAVVIEPAPLRERVINELTNASLNMSTAGLASLIAFLRFWVSPMIHCKDTVQLWKMPIGSS